MASVHRYRRAWRGRKLPDTYARGQCRGCYHRNHDFEAAFLVGKRINETATRLAVAGHSRAPQEILGHAHLCAKSLDELTTIGHERSHGH